MEFSENTNKVIEDIAKTINLNDENNETQGNEETAGEISEACKQWLASKQPDYSLNGKKI